ncbi:MAG: HAD-IA family hydrolase [Betaproteobacteria bacterium]|nr:HAD-IA family hydrolase [Betaproteobacteria bacterium]
MTLRYRMVVFDWDGTVMDSTSLIAQCIQRAAVATGLREPGTREAKAVIGLGVRDSIERLFPGIDSGQANTFGMHYRAHFLAHDHETPLYEGMRELLGALDQRERILAVATGKSRRGLDRALNHSGLAGRFQFTRCADEGFPKPHPDMLERLMDFAGVERGQVLMIGDTTHDLDLARNAGVDAVAVSYGAHPAALLVDQGAKAVVSSVGELGEWLMRNA